MTDNTSKPVTGAELGELEAFLLSSSAPSGTMDLDMLDGFFAALASGPEPLQPEQWLPLVWGPEAESPPDFASVEEMEKMLSLMVRYKHLVESVLLLDPESYQPLFGRCSFSDSLEERAAVENWARGFLLGIGPVRETWQPLFDGDTEFSVIAPVFLLADIGDERDIDEVQWLQCRDGVAECVRAIHRFWTPFRGKTGTVERPSSEGIDDRQDDDFSRECQCRRDKDKG